MSEPLTLTDPVENHRLKDKTEAELFNFILENNKWQEDEIESITSAYNLATKIHEQDEYKGQPYIYHLLRVAARISGYLNIYDAEIVVASLLHDSVEDHSEKIVPNTPGGPFIQKQAALARISELYTPRTAQMIAAVSNEPQPEGLTEGEKLSIYQAKVKLAVSTVEGWVIKFSDWCENGVGLIHGIEGLSAVEIAYFQRKYGGEVLETYERRFREPDIQSTLDWAAKGYVEYQLAQGRDRLSDGRTR